MPENSVKEDNKIQTFNNIIISSLALNKNYQPCKKVGNYNQKAKEKCVKITEMMELEFSYVLKSSYKHTQGFKEK